VSAALRNLAAPCLTLVIAFGGFVGGCRREAATQAQCAEVLDRIIQLELAEQGFRDPVLVARKQVELRALLAPQLTACVDRRLPAGALECVRRARTAEEISHACLH